MIELKKLSFAYKNGKLIRYPDWSLIQGTHALVFGRKGSGKSTLLYLISGLLKPHSGMIEVCDKKITGIKGAELDKFRGKYIGFVSANPVFIPEFTMQDNFLLAQQMGSGREDVEKIYLLMHEFGIAGRALDFPAALSPVELRIAAILRAVINRPKIILADEPTGWLTEKESHFIFKMLTHQAQNYEATLVIASRNSRIQEIFRNRLKLEIV